MEIDHNDIWKALSDPTRREILDFLREGSRSTTEIVERFPKLSRFGVMKHIDVLREANLIVTMREGRRRVNSLNAVPLRQILERWVNKFQSFWANSLVRVQESSENIENDLD